MEINLPECQGITIQGMVPFYGETPEEVVTFIVTNYLHDHMEKICDNLDTLEWIERRKEECQ